jgi:hypothetical protein
MKGGERLSENNVDLKVLESTKFSPIEDSIVTGEDSDSPKS